jgi:bacteriocin biosynthesis cyclodehydratase domain-containing protein
MDNPSNHHHSPGHNVAGDQPLRALPAQLIATSSGAALKRGCVEIRIGGDRAVEALQIVLAACTSESATADEICALFAGPDRPAISSLIEELASRSIIVPADSPLLPPPSGESALDVFYWNFGESTAVVTDRIAETRFVAVGVNYITRQLAAAFEASGIGSLTVVDYPALRNVALFDDAGLLRNGAWHGAAPVAFEASRAGLLAGEFDCLIAASDFGGMQSMREWNNLCVARGRSFLPIVLHNMRGYVGPMVIAGEAGCETACYECFLARRTSNIDPNTVEPALDAAAFAGQGIAGFHPSMASVLGDLATIELTKFHSRALPLWKVGRSIEVNLIAGSITTRKVLRVPRCPVCSSMVRHSSMSTIKSSVAGEVILQ